jgi:murein DD-endopeptidase MepM/ murein hydrolase activator NlpD
MQSRYLGSDSLSQRQLQVQQETAEANTTAIGRIAKSTDAVVQGLVQGQQQIGQMQVAYATAQAQAAQNNPLSGLNESVQTGVRVYNAVEDNRRQQQKLEFDQAYKIRQEEAEEAKARAKAQADEREAMSKVDFVGAKESLGNIRQKYIQSNWNEGTLNYKSESSKALAKYKNLTPDQLATLVDEINGTADGRDNETRKAIEGEVEKQQLQQATAAKNQLEGALIPQIAKLKTLPPTEQALPFLQSFDEQLDAFMKQNNGLTYTQKLEAVNNVSTLILDAFKTKADVYAQWRRSMESRAEWAVGHQKAYAQYQQDQDLGKYKDAMLLLKINTGRDYSNDIVAPGEAERITSDIANSFENLQRISDVRKERTGVGFQFDNDDIRTAAAGIIVANLSSDILSNPLLAKNPGIKAAVELANSIRKARQDEAKLGVINAQTQREIASFDISNANNFGSVTRQLINANRSGKQASPENQYFAEVLEKANQATGGQLGQAVTVIEQAGDRPLTAEEISSIQQTLNNSQAAIRNAQAAAKAEFGAKVNQFNVDNEEILKLFGGRIPTDAELAQLYKSGRPRFQQTLQKWQSDVETSGRTVTPYGQQSNFNQVNQGLGAFGSPDGKVYIAPRTVAHVQRQSADGGQPFITPISSANPVNHSFNKGMNGGGYRAGRPGGRLHAGIDFPLAQGQKAISVVSGTVVRVGTAQGYGNYIDVMGDNGFVYRYAHSRSLVQEGTRVQAGQPVASPNMSGTNIGGAHLHFEVRNGSNYNRDADWGIGNTVDPVAHLRNLTLLAGESVAAAPQLRGQSVGAVSRQLPWAKTTAPSLFTPAGGALQANLFQQVGKPVLNASRVFNSQRPLTKGSLSGSTGGQKPVNNPTETYGYAWLKQRPEFTAKLAQIADGLGVPASWVVDIMRQESGDNFFMARKFHSRGGNRNYGLFGFGSDSGVANYYNLNEVQQLDAYYNYMMRNGWGKHLQRTKGNVSIAQLWAMTRMGTKWRADILNGRDPASLRLNDTGKTYADEIGLLGKWAGRQYNLNSGSLNLRSQRNRAIGRRASSVVDQALVGNNSLDVQYRTTTI